MKDCPCVVHGLFLFRFVGGFYYIVPHYDIIRVMIILGLWPVAAQNGTVIFLGRQAHDVRPHGLYRVKIAFLIYKIIIF